MNPLALDDIRLCLEGIIPAIIATCAADGTPNVAYLSQVYYVDPGHVALSFQFFNKTRQNILANPDATLLLLDPHTFAFYRLGIRYLHTQTEGPVFESMRHVLVLEGGAVIVCGHCCRQLRDAFRPTGRGQLQQRARPEQVGRR